MFDKCINKGYLKLTLVVFSHYYMYESLHSVQPIVYILCFFGEQLCPTFIIFDEMVMIFYRKYQFNDIMYLFHPNN